MAWLFPETEAKPERTRPGTGEALAFVNRFVHLAHVQARACATLGVSDAYTLLLHHQHHSHESFHWGRRLSASALVGLEAAGGGASLRVDKHVMAVFV